MFLLCGVVSTQDTIHSRHHSEPVTKLMNTVMRQQVYATYQISHHNGDTEKQYRNGGNKEILQMEYQNIAML
jgi:hypothetical protein